jgi:putative ABC transport system substrate-binding protein
VDELLRGTKVGDIPIYQPTTFLLVINSKTAQGLGLAIPSSLALRADDIID